MAGNMTLAGNSEFKSWVSQLKKDIRSAQVKAAIKVNTELLRLYCIIAKTICTNFQNEMCKNRHFFVVCLPVLEYHLKGF